jgi:23S rRNA (guanosine2251-2'-O)-methyltransferase
MRKLSLQELNRASIEAFKAQEKTPIVLVLDNVRSALNVGSAFRTADAFALKKIYLCGITAQPPHKEILKTAIGATESMDWAYFEDSAEAVRQLKEEGYLIAGVEQAEERTWLQDFQPPKEQPIALVFGNEVTGVSDEVMELLDVCLEVPQLGTKHSLNISVCVGVVIWDLFAKLNFWAAPVRAREYT